MFLSTPQPAAAYVLQTARNHKGALDRADTERWSDFDFSLDTFITIITFTATLTLTSLLKSETNRNVS